MRTFRVELGPNSHPVFVGVGILDNLGELARGAGLIPGRAALITDRNIAPLYADRTRKSLSAAGFDAAIVEIAPGEASKSLATYERMLDAMAEAGLDRRSTVFALGGGVVGDLAGFAAATYMRGIAVVQVPTSVVAQVDSALGGKTGVDHRRAKNLIGAFHHPRLVLADVATLKTLPEREFREGLAEVIKYGAIMDAAMFAALEADLPSILARDTAKLEDIIEQSLRCKASVVSQDEREGNLRKVLNFGHTVGHAIEAAGDYSRFLHGEAVAIGMVVATGLSRIHAGLPESDAKRLLRLIEQAGLPARMPDWRNERFSKALELDKKRAGDGIDFVLISAIGHTLIKKLTLKEITNHLETT